MDRQEAVDRLEEIRDEIEELANDALGIVRQVAPGEVAYAKGYWHAHIVTALRDDAGYLGGSMGPMQSTIDSLREPDEIALVCIDCGDVHDAVRSIEELPFPENVEDRGDGPQVEQGRCPFCRGEDQP